MNYDGNYPYAGGTKGKYRKETVDVGRLANENAYGCYDFHGNVWDWCEDWYTENYQDLSSVDPNNAKSGPHRLNRGAVGIRTPGSAGLLTVSGFTPTAATTSSGFGAFWFAPSSVDLLTL